MMNRGTGGRSGGFGGGGDANPFGGFGRFARTTDAKRPVTPDSSDDEGPPDVR